jgi:hypothetical protein
MNIVEMLADVDENILIADGFDDALIGYVEMFGNYPVALYDRDKCISILMENSEMDEIEAIEFFEFNVIAYMGEHTPAFATLLNK